MILGKSQTVHSFNSIQKGKRLHTKEDSELLTVDDDTLGVNNFKVYSVNDTKGLFVFDLIQFPYVLNGTSASAANLKIGKVILFKYIDHKCKVKLKFEEK